MPAARNPRTKTATAATPRGFFFNSGLDVLSECDPFAMDCPDAEKCVPFSSTGTNWDANHCVPVTGTSAAGEPCTYGGVVEATDDCDANTICWGDVCTP